MCITVSVILIIKMIYPKFNALIGYRTYLVLVLKYRRSYHHHYLLPTEQNYRRKNNALIMKIIFLIYRYLAILGLVLIAIGTGGIKPCVSSFGGDQFNLPTQEKYLQKFFSIFYFFINAGSLFSTSVTPELREGHQCFGRDSCFPLAFGVPAVLMLISISK